MKFLEIYEHYILISISLKYDKLLLVYELRIELALQHIDLTKNGALISSCLDGTSYDIILCLYNILFMFSYLPMRLAFEQVVSLV